MKYDVKIKNKTKDGCLIKSLTTGKEVKLTWDEFNAQFDLVDLYYGNLKEEIKKMYEEAAQLAAQVPIYTLQANNSSSPMEKMKAYGMITVIFEKIQKLTNWTNAEVWQFIRVRINIANELRNMSQKDFDKMIDGSIIE